MFVPGKSGNPDGRSKASHDARRLWESLLAQLKDGKPRVQHLLERYYEIACDDPATCRDAVNRILGKVPDQLELRHERVVLDWGDSADNDAAVAHSPAEDSAVEGAVQGGDLRSALGEDAAGSGDELR